MEKQITDITNAKSQAGSTPEAVVLYVKELIKNKEVMPGDLLPSEKQLQSILGVSRFALREGLARLSALGIIRIVKGKGSIISDQIDLASVKDVFLPLHIELDAKKQEDLLESRIVLEGEMTSLAAQRRTEAHLELLEQNVKQSIEALQEPNEFSELDWEFHAIISEACANLFLQQMHMVIRDQLQPILQKHAADSNQRNLIIKKHTNVLEAIRNQDAHSAKALAIENIKAFEKDYGLEE